MVLIRCQHITTVVITMLTPTILVILTILLAVSSAERTIVRPNGWTYKIDDTSEMSFDQALGWCTSLGGNLASIHSDDDLNFLVDSVLQYHNIAWIGSRKVNGNCETYTDGTPVDYKFVYTGNTCLTCGPPSYCCLVVYHGEEGPKRVFYDPCNRPDARAVCVIKKTLKGEIGSANNETIS